MIWQKTILPSLKLDQGGDACPPVSGRTRTDFAERTCSRGSLCGDYYPKYPGVSILYPHLPVTCIRKTWREETEGIQNFGAVDATYHQLITLRLLVKGAICHQSYYVVVRDFNSARVLYAQHYSIARHGELMRVTASFPEPQSEPSSGAGATPGMTHVRPFYALVVHVYHDRAELLNADMLVGEEKGLLASSVKSWQAVEEKVWQKYKELVNDDEWDGPRWKQSVHWPGLAPLVGVLIDCATDPAVQLQVGLRGLVEGAEYGVLVGTKDVYNFQTTCGWVGIKAVSNHQFVPVSCDLPPPTDTARYSLQVWVYDVSNHERLADENALFDFRAFQSPCQGLTPS